MAEGPNIWDIHDDIVLEIFVADTTTGDGIAGQTAYIDVTIRRDSDAKYWAGNAWSNTRTLLVPTEADSTNQPGRYTYTLSGTPGNVRADRYVMHVVVDNPPLVEGTAYEVHVSREQDIKVYESESV